MEFIKILLQYSTIREAKLLNSAIKANANPEIGVTITHKAAFHVIKDCAGVASKYVPHLVFGSYTDPFTTLRGKFTRKNIQELVAVSSSDIPTAQLIALILDKASKMKLIQAPKPSEIAINFEQDDNSDPYGDYGSTIEEEVVVTPLASSSDEIVNALATLFAAK